MLQTCALSRIAASIAQIEAAIRDKAQV